MSDKGKFKAAAGGRGSGGASSGSGGGSSSSSSGGHGAGTGNRGSRGNSLKTPKQGATIKVEVGAGGVLGQPPSAASSMAGMAHSSGEAGPMTPSKVPLDEDGVSSHADSDAHSSVSQQGAAAADQSMRIAQLEQQLRELQMARVEQLALGGSAPAVQAGGPSQWQQQQQPQQPQQQQQQQPS